MRFFVRFVDPAKNIDRIPDAGPAASSSPKVVVAGGSTPKTFKAETIAKEVAAAKISSTSADFKPISNERVSEDHEDDSPPSERASSSLPSSKRKRRKKSVLKRKSNNGNQRRHSNIDQSDVVEAVVDPKMEQVDCDPIFQMEDLDQVRLLFTLVPKLVKSFA